MNLSSKSWEREHLFMDFAGKDILRDVDVFFMFVLSHFYIWWIWWVYIAYLSLSFIIPSTSSWTGLICWRQFNGYRKKMRLYTWHCIVGKNTLDPVFGWPLIRLWNVIDHKKVSERETIFWDIWASVQVQASFWLSSHWDRMPGEEFVILEFFLVVYYVNLH